MRSGFVSEAANNRCFSPSFRETSKPNKLANVRTPMPPTCIPNRMTISPKSDQCSAMFTTVRPVTHTADTAVNKLSASGVICPVRVEMGSDSTAVNTKMSSVKTMMAKREGEELAKWLIHSRTTDLRFGLYAVWVFLTHQLSSRTVFDCHATRIGHYPRVMADIFSVIADPTRRDILLTLLDRYRNNQEMSVSEIVTQLETSQPTVSKHLKVLREAELVTVREDGQHRYYALNPEPLEIVEDFVIPFLSADFDTEVSFEYVTDGGSFPDEEVLSESVTSAAASLGRVAAEAEHQVRELVARFRYR